MKFILIFVAIHTEGFGINLWEVPTITTIEFEDAQACGSGAATMERVLRRSIRVQRISYECTIKALPPIIAP
jgi:hypothetical protein